MILGASIRAAAQSALRAGLRPAGIDLFADLDLMAACPATRIDRARYPDGLEALAAEGLSTPWFFTGALENHPQLIDRLADTRPLWGIGGRALRAVRDPGAVREVLRASGLPGPEVRRDAEGLPRDGSWLVKPLDSAGGRGIVPLRSGTAGRHRSCYYQEWVDGLPLSALFVGSDRGSRLLGVSFQWLGRPGSPYSYRGSIGPWPLSEVDREKVERLGDVLTSSFGLLGLFGIDLIWRDSQPWPVEVNPRYTASVEVLELALGRALLMDHRRVFDPGAPTLELSSANGRSGVVGKAILFAERPCSLAEPITPAPHGFRPFAIPELADIPPFGTHFQAGEPVLTLFAEGSGVADCRDQLDRALSNWQRKLVSLNDL